MASSNPLARVFWNPVIGYLVAAIIALFWLFQPSKLPIVRTVKENIPYPAAIIDVELPRPAGDSAIYWSPSQDIYLMLRGMVAPQGGGHEYSIELTYGPKDSSIILLHNNRDFDSIGNVVFATQTSVGDFKLKIYDMLGTDTTARVYPFVIRFEK
jgi:hypothetical protein